MGSAGFVWTASGTYNVKESVWDEAWNTDYCQVELRIKTQEEGSDIIAGNVSTYQGNPLSGVTVSIDGNLPEFPKTTLTDQNGDYSMLCPEGIAYDVQASFDGEYLNGVSTLDLVFIQRHIFTVILF